MSEVSWGGGRAVAPDLDAMGKATRSSNGGPRY